MRSVVCWCGVSEMFTGKMSILKLWAFSFLSPEVHVGGWLLIDLNCLYFHPLPFHHDLPASP